MNMLISMIYSIVCVESMYVCTCPKVWKPEANVGCFPQYSPLYV